MANQIDFDDEIRDYKRGLDDDAKRVAEGRLIITSVIIGAVLIFLIGVYAVIMIDRMILPSPAEGLVLNVYLIKSGIGDVSDVTVSDIEIEQGEPNVVKGNEIQLLDKKKRILNQSGYIEVISFPYYEEAEYVMINSNPDYYYLISDYIK